MIRELMFKWFGIVPTPCSTCEVLRLALDESTRERKELLNRLLEKDKPEPPPLIKEEELTPITPKFIPWHVRQQMLEAEDRKAATLLRDKEKEIAALEKELGIAPVEGVQ